MNASPNLPFVGVPDKVFQNPGTTTVNWPDLDEDFKLFMNHNREYDQGFQILEQKEVILLGKFGILGGPS